jgi:hypothetical protein
MKIEYTNVQPLVEGIKEMGRIVLLGTIPVILTSINTSTGDIKINWSIVLATALTLLLTAILKGVDKDIHLTGKIEGDDTKTKGLTQF